MKKPAKIKSNVSASVIKMVENEYDWSGKIGAILLKETKIYIKALEAINYTEKQIIRELKINGNLSNSNKNKLPKRSNKKLSNRLL